MLTLEKMYEMGHEEVVFYADPSCNLKAIIAIHDTTLGPALGGTRMWPYKSEEEALTDVLRLSRGMTYKAAVSGLDLGCRSAVRAPWLGCHRETMRQLAAFPDRQVFPRRRCRRRRQPAALCQSVHDAVYCLRPGRQFDAHL